MAVTAGSQRGAEDPVWLLATVEEVWSQLQFLCCKEAFSDAIDPPYRICHPCCETFPGLLREVADGIRKILAEQAFLRMAREFEQLASDFELFKHRKCKVNVNEPFRYVRQTYPEVVHQLEALAAGAQSREITEIVNALFTSKNSKQGATRILKLAKQGMKPVQIEKELKTSSNRGFSLSNISTILKNVRQKFPNFLQN